jgi:integrase
VEHDYIRKAPARLLRLPTLKPVEKPFLSQAEITRLLQNAEGMHRLLLRTELVTGLRPSELLAVRWSSLDAQNKLLHIRESVYKGQLRPFTKTTDKDSRRELQIVYLPAVLVRDLANYRKTCRWKSDTDFIFAGRNGEAQWVQNYQKRVLAPLRKKAGIAKLNFQILRRTVSTHAQGFGSAKDIASILRHTKPDTAALHYTQTQDESVRRTVERLSELIQG